MKQKNSVEKCEICEEEVKGTNFVEIHYDRVIVSGIYHRKCLVDELKQNIDLI